MEETVLREDHRLEREVDHQSAADAARGPEIDMIEIETGIGGVDLETEEIGVVIGTGRELGQGHRGGEVIETGESHVVTVRLLYHV